MAESGRAPAANHRDTSTCFAEHLDDINNRKMVVVGSVHSKKRRLVEHSRADQKSPRLPMIPGGQHLDGRLLFGELITSVLVLCIQAPTFRIDDPSAVVLCIPDEEAARSYRWPDVHGLRVDLVITSMLATDVSHILEALGNSQPTEINLFDVADHVLIPIQSAQGGDE